MPLPKPKTQGVQVVSDLLEPEHLEDPYPLYARLRAEGGVHRLADTNFYVATTWDTVQAATARTDDFSSNIVSALHRGPDGCPAAHTVAAYRDVIQVLPTADPPDHTHHRRLVQPHLSPAALVELEVADHGADELVVTEDMRERKGEMDRRSDAFITLPGGIGTLEELLEIWVARSLRMHDKPVVVLDPWGDLQPLAELVAGLVKAGFVRDSAAAQLVWTTSVDDAIAAVERGWAEAGSVGVAEPTPAEFLEAEP